MHTLLIAGAPLKQQGMQDRLQRCVNTDSIKINRPRHILPRHKPDKKMEPFAL